MISKDRIQEALDWFKKKNTILKFFLHTPYYSFSHFINCKMANCDSLSLRDDHLTMMKTTYIDNYDECDIFKIILDKNKYTDIFIGRANPKLLLKKNTSIESLLLERDIES